MTLIGAVLGAPSEAGRDAAAMALLNYGFATFRLETPVRRGEVLSRPLVKDDKGVRARLIAASTYTHVFPRSAPVRVSVRAPAQLAGPLPARAVVGTAVITAGGRVQARIPLLLDRALPKIRTAKPVKSVVLLSATLSGLVLVAGAAVGLRMFRRSSTRG